MRKLNQICKTCRYPVIISTDLLCTSTNNTEVMPVFSRQSGQLIGAFLAQMSALSLVNNHFSFLAANLKLSRHVAILTITCTHLIITISAGRNNLPARQAYPDYPRNTSLTHPATGQREEFLLILHNL